MKQSAALFFLIIAFVLSTLHSHADDASWHFSGGGIGLYHYFSNNEFLNATGVAMVDTKCRGTQVGGWFSVGKGRRALNVAAYGGPTSVSAKDEWGSRGYERGYEYTSESDRLDIDVALNTITSATYEGNDWNYFGYSLGYKHINVDMHAVYKETINNPAHPQRTASLTYDDTIMWNLLSMGILGAMRGKYAGFTGSLNLLTGMRSGTAVDGKNESVNGIIDIELSPKQSNFAIGGSAQFGLQVFLGKHVSSMLGMRFHIMGPKFSEIQNSLLATVGMQF